MFSLISNTSREFHKILLNCLRPPVAFFRLKKVCIRVGEVGGQKIGNSAVGLNKLEVLGANRRPFLSETHKAFSLNAIVDVRRRRHEMIFLKYLGNY